MRPCCGLHAAAALDRHSQLALRRYLLTFAASATTADVEAFCTSLESQPGSGCAHLYTAALLGCAAKVRQLHLTQACECECTS